MMKFIEVNLRYAATHNWPEARELAPEVGYLAEEHRHEFHIKLVKEVSHNDRDVEIILFKMAVEAYLVGKYDGKLGRMSCEDLAEELLNEFNCSTVRVLEDGENGAIIQK